MKLNRREALDSVRANVQDKNMIKHMWAAEAIMRALASRLGEDEDEWGITGLLHDIDVELVEGDMDSYSKLGADIARELGANEAMAHAILCHNEAHGIPRETRLDHALFCADFLSRLITAAALIHPDKLKGLTAESVLRRFEEQGFAAGISGEKITGCQELGLKSEEFAALGLEAMKSIAPQLRL
jgi:putative nucleotidyltransferase with HDIG domain